MKKNILLGFMLAAISLNSLVTLAATDAKYPAADFQPTVIYVDKDLVVAQSASATEFDAKYPAAHFEPKVVYIDKDLAEQSEDQTDTKYPAAYFKPRVIFP